MSPTVNLVALQMTSTPDPQQNLQWVEHVLKTNDVAAGSIIVLPECFACFGAGDKAQFAIREPLEGGDIASRLSELAASLDCHLFAGTVPAMGEDEAKFTATCRYFDRQGLQQITYNKIHLFDVTVDDATGSYRESAMTQPGEKVVVVEVEGLKVGIAVCYDVRFPGLFDAMGDVDMIVLPSAFTQKTGSAHWDTLVRARAIEKQCFIVAANQVGVHANGRQTYGHSLIVSPWGEILAEKHDAPGCIQTTIDTSRLAKIKQAMPVQQHSMFRSQLVK